MSSSGVDKICLTYWSLSQSQTGVYHLIPLCGFIHSLALHQVLLFPSCSHVCSASNICLPTIPLPPSLPFSLPPPLRPNQTDRQVTPSACSPANQSVFFPLKKHPEVSSVLHLFLCLSCLRYLVPLLDSCKSGNHFALAQFSDVRHGI